MIEEEVVVEVLEEVVGVVAVDLEVVVDLEVEVVEEDGYNGEGEAGNHCDCHRVL